MCASFGAGLSSVCVVDVGDQKASVCCVEDGISLEPTRYVLPPPGGGKVKCWPVDSAHDLKCK